MATQRFPKAKYLRQLADMQNELQAWKLAYRLAEFDHPDDWIGSRFLARGIEVEKAIEQLQELRETLYAIPRLT